MAAKQKWYVVLKGHQPGIYSSWPEAQAQVNGFPGPVFKSFETQPEAERAWYEKRFPAPARSPDSKGKAATGKIPARPSGYFLVVDAGSLGVPGPTEYQGFLMPGQQKLFYQHVGLGTNNLGEFLAIVHALAYLYRQESNLPVYSDSRTAISWVLKKKVKSELERDSRTEKVWELVDRAVQWLHTHPVSNRVLKWETEYWGENPADFGRK